MRVLYGSAVSYAAVHLLYCYRLGYVCRHSNATVRIFCSLNVRALQAEGVVAEELVE